MPDDNCLGCLLPKRYCVCGTLPNANLAALVEAIESADDDE